MSPIEHPYRPDLVKSRDKVTTARESGPSRAVNEREQIASDKSGAQAQRYAIGKEIPSSLHPDVIKAKRKRLFILQRIQAEQGRDTPANILGEIEDLKEELGATERPLEETTRTISQPQQALRIERGKPERGSRTSEARKRARYREFRDKVRDVRKELRPLSRLVEAYGQALAPIIERDKELQDARHLLALLDRVDSAEEELGEVLLKHTETTCRQIKTYCDSIDFDAWSGNVNTCAPGLVSRAELETHELGKRALRDILDTLAGLDSSWRPRDLHEALAQLTRAVEDIYRCWHRAVRTLENEIRRRMMLIMDALGA